MATETLPTSSTDSQMEAKRPLKRKLKQPQSPLACESCRAKKVRCDLTERRTQCTRCENHGTKCNIVPGKRRHLVQRIFGNTALGSPPGTGYGCIDSISSHSDYSSPSSASDGPHSPFSTVSWTSRASSTTSIDSADAHFPGFSGKSHSACDVALPTYVKPMPATLSLTTYEDLKCKGCFDLPDADTWMDLVESYLNWVHPILPMIDVALLNVLGTSEPIGTSISLLLLKSIEMVAHISSRRDSMIANNLARQVEALLRARIETDPPAVLQSLILMSFCDGGQPGLKDGYHWIGAASLYTSRLSAAGRLVRDDGRSMRQMLQCLVMRDSVLALAARKPRQVNNEIDAFTSPSSFDESWLLSSILDDRDIDMAPDGRAAMESWSPKSFRELSEAVKLTVDVKLAWTCSASINEATHLLRVWYQNWHEQLRQNVESPAELVHCSILLGHWSLAVLTLHCWSPQSAASSTSDTLHDHGLVAAALNCITAVYTRLYEQNLIHHIPGTAVAALVPAAVAHLMNSTSQEKQVRAVNSQKYYQCWQMLRELRSKYRTAYQAMTMLDSLGQDLRQGFDNSEDKQLDKLRQWCSNMSKVSVVTP